MRFKIILLGDPKVGKTTIRRTFMGISPEQSYVKTIGVDFSIFRNDKGVFQIWDIAGESGKTPLRNLFKNYVVGTHGAILLFDIVNIETLDDCNLWIESLYDELGYAIPIAIVGNKIDLRDNSDENTTLINETRIKQKFDELNSMDETGKIEYFETSALLNTNVDDVFYWMFDVIPEEGD